MLNNHQLSLILGVQLPPLTLRDIHWRTQDCDSGSLLFYKIPDDAKSEEAFHSRMKNCSFGWLIINRKVDSLPLNCTIVPEGEWPEIQNKILDILYPLPELKLIGITGTNGKTTTTDLVLQLGHLAGKKGLSIGTLGVREYQKTILDFGLTSPSFIDLRKFLANYGKGKDFCVMEASSHALVQDRLHGISFDSAGWLSFSQDHLDYHKTMDEYFQAKALIFKKVKEHGSVFVPREQEDLFKRLQLSSPKAQMAPAISGTLPLFFQTKFNRNNLEVAQAIIDQVFGKQEVDYQKLFSPDGRFYIQPYRSNLIVVDFAHTPDALENICQGIRTAFPQHRLKVLFGCGGDRDRSKRPKMAEVVAQWAEEIYVTSDNPRSENPDQIIHDIIQGLHGKNFKTITERPKAVKLAFEELTENEVLLLAGKGHEDYILINGVKHPYSDIREVDAFIARNRS